MTKEEKMRKEFEANAKAYGFDMKRYSTLCTTGEPWIDYDSLETGHRWGGWLAACEIKQKEIDRWKAVAENWRVKAVDWSRKNAELPVEPEEVYSPHTIITDDKCRKCAGQMLDGKAIAQTFTGKPDFIGSDEVVTVSAGGSGKMIECRKCSECGWSVST